MARTRAGPGFGDDEERRSHEDAHAETLEAPAGTTSIELANESSLPHNVAIEGGDVDEESETVTNDSTSLTVELESGTYTFFCSVPGHREGGMEGTLTVG